MADLTEETAARFCESIDRFAIEVAAVARSTTRIMEGATAQSLTALVELRSRPYVARAIDAEKLAKHLGESLTGTRAEVDRLNDRRVELENEVAALKRAARPMVRSWLGRMFTK